MKWMSTAFICSLGNGPNPCDFEVKHEAYLLSGCMGRRVT